MKKVLVTMMAVSQYIVEIEIEDHIDDQAILEIARNSVNHDQDVSDLQWKESGYWYQSNNKAYNISEAQ